MPYTAKNVAAFMVSELTERGRIYPEQLASSIRSRFGQEFTAQTEHGYITIRRDVVRAFKNLVKHSVVWMPGDRCWRKK